MTLLLRSPSVPPPHRLPLSCSPPQQSSLRFSISFFCPFVYTLYLYASMGHSPPTSAHGPGENLGVFRGAAGRVPQGRVRRFCIFGSGLIGSALLFAPGIASRGAFGSGFCTEPTIARSGGERTGEWRCWRRPPSLSIMRCEAAAVLRVILFPCVFQWPASALVLLFVSIFFFFLLSPSSLHLPSLTSVTPPPPIPPPRPSVSSSLPTTIALKLYSFLVWYMYLKPSRNVRFAMCMCAYLLFEAGGGGRSLPKSVYSFLYHFSFGFRCVCVVCVGVCPFVLYKQLTSSAVM